MAWDDFSSAGGAPSAKKVTRARDALDDPDMAANAPWYENVAAGMGQAFTQAGRGIGQLVGLVDQKDIDEAAARDAPLLRTGAGLAGNIAGNIALTAPTALVPGAATVPGAALIQGATQALMTPGGLKDRAMAGGMAAAAGAAGAKVSNIMAKKPAFAPSDDVKAMIDAGVDVTPGQNLGGMFARAEEKLKQTPFLGDVLGKAGDRTLDDFNAAGWRQASVPNMGIRTASIGHDAVSDLKPALGGALDNLAARSTVNTLDPRFINELAGIRAKAQALPQRMAQTFDKDLGYILGNRVDATGRLSGKPLQEAATNLATRSMALKGSTDPLNNLYHRELGMRLEESRDALMKLMATANPQLKSERDAVNAAYTNFVRLKEAAEIAAGAEGKFTPNQLLTAAKRMAPVGDSVAMGKAPMQAFAAAGKNVLPARYHSDKLSGSLPMMIATGALTGPLGLLAAPLYSRGGSRAVNAVVNSGVRPLAELMRRGTAKNPALTAATLAALTNAAD